MARFEIDATTAGQAREALMGRVLPEVAVGDVIVLRLDPSKRELATFVVPEGPWEMDFSCYAEHEQHAGAITNASAEPVGAVSSALTEPAGVGESNADAPLSAGTASEGGAVPSPGAESEPWKPSATAEIDVDLGPDHDVRVAELHLQPPANDSEREPDRTP